MNPNVPNTLTREWLSMLDLISNRGHLVSPRGILTAEILQHTMCVDMRHPVLLAPTRKLSEKFLGAEAHWILSGDNRVETIERYNKNIAKFSDDGVTFFGAYGPKFVEQVDYVVDKLKADRDTRQAGMTFWRENPPETKDVPCTIAVFFAIRDGALNCHVYMRSSDAWLGVPYDVFNFSMMAHLVLCRINSDRPEGEKTLYPGTLYLTAASRHIYNRDMEQVDKVLMHDAPWASSEGTPHALFTNEDALMRTLQAIADGNEEAKWWKEAVS